ncbi:MAG: hypothetical protein KBA46_00320 [Candidatus Omnitrophica bacterium]|nr:hypothetical protein [Candidatus Omnitrophota bacterium]
MRKVSVWLMSAVVVLSLLAPLRAADDQWRQLRSTHVIVYYKNAPEQFIERVKERAEDYYDKIADDLGFTRYKFWLWDNRASIYIFDNMQDFQAQTNQPSWSAGAVKIREKIIYTYPDERGFFETILPHEMGHIIFREFVGPHNNAIPVWLDEGVASYQEAAKRAMTDSIIRDALKKGTLVSVERLMSVNPQFLQDTQQVNLFYAQALGLISFLIREFGKDNFVFFCQELRDKKDFSRALSYAFGFKNIQEFDRAWQRYLSHE